MDCLTKGLTHSKVSSRPALVNRTYCDDENGQYLCFPIGQPLATYDC